MIVKYRQGRQARAAGAAAARRASAFAMVRQLPRVPMSRFSGPAGELKFFDTALSFLVDATAEVPVSGQVTLIPQGVTESTRVGRKATIKSVRVQGSAVFAPSSAANAATIAVLYLVQDTQANGAAAAVSDVFTSTTLTSANMNLANSGRFKILKKIVIPMNASAGVTTAYCNVAKYVDFYKKVSIPIEYSSTTGAITEIRSNNLFLVAGTDGNSDDAVSFNGSCRLRFSDN